MRTFSVDPEKRTFRLPVIEYAALKEPFRGSLMMYRTCDVMVGRWVWWREPPAKVLSHLIPYNDVLGPWMRPNNARK
jgi:hypothetical protein